MNYIKQVNTFYELLPNNPLSSNAQCLYFYLLNLNNRLGWIEEFTVANSLICGYVNYNRQILDRARNELVQKGYINYIKGKSNQAGKYSIVKFDTQDNTQDNIQSKTQTNTQDNTHNNTQTVHTVIPLNKQNINKTKNKKESKKEISYDEIISQNVKSEELKNVLLEFIKMRKLIKAPLTDNALILAIKKLERLAPNDIEKQIAIVQQSIMNSWKGLFELKEVISVKASNNISKNEMTKEEQEEFDRRMELKFENEGLM